MLFRSPSSLQPQVKAGALKMLANSSTKRSSTYPEIPTVTEMYPGFSGAETFYAVLAPAMTPPAIVEKLKANIRQVLASADIKERLAALGADLVGASPSDTLRYIDV